jgi:hypothetical protein
VTLFPTSCGFALRLPDVARFSQRTISGTSSSARRGLSITLWAVTEFIRQYRLLMTTRIGRKITKFWGKSLSFLNFFHKNDHIFCFSSLKLHEKALKGNNKA